MRAPEVEVSGAGGAGLQGRRLDSEILKGSVSYGMLTITCTLRRNSKWNGGGRPSSGPVEFCTYGMDRNILSMLTNNEPCESPWK